MDHIAHAVLLTQTDQLNSVQCVHTSLVAGHASLHRGRRTVRRFTWLNHDSCITWNLWLNGYFMSSAAVFLYYSQLLLFIDKKKTLSSYRQSTRILSQVSKPECIQVRRSYSGKMLRWCWQMHTTWLEVRQGHQT